MLIMDALGTHDKDLPLRDDIRLIGRILGDTVRSQEDEAVDASRAQGGATTSG